MSGTVRFGYTVMTEQSGPRELVGYAVDAERAGFDFGVCGDHYSPSLTSQGHAPHAWTLLGAVAQATSCWDPSQRFQDEAATPLLDKLRAEQKDSR